MIRKILCLLILAAPVYGQQNTTNSIKRSLASIHVVKLDLPGRLTISNSNAPQMDIEYSILSSGKIIGLSNKDNDFIYKPILRISHDTLYISAKRETWSVVGFSSYKEEISQLIYLPKDIHLIVQAHEELTINGSYKKVRVFNSKITILNLIKTETGKIICHAEKGPLKLNGEHKERRFEFAGLSNTEYVIDSKSIFINLN